ncbi:MAG: serine/threonine protein kinase [Deltaproteobacteria bacterium]|nr:serine/threonine protein kinase [Deltaproteobacteria bacterium]
MSSSIDKYEIIDLIARGGVADLYRARLKGAKGFEKIVAVKVVDQRNASVQAIQLTNEAHLCSYLSHPNIISVIDLGEEGGYLYIVMEYIEGGDLRQLLQALGGPPFSEAAVLYVMKEVLSGLSYAHRYADRGGERVGIIHKDISPSNILVSYQGEVKIADFGIGSFAASTGLTDQTGIWGKLPYLSPEQRSGGEIDARSDLFSLGLVSYELLTGKKLFDGGSASEVLEKGESFNAEKWHELGDFLHKHFVYAAPLVNQMLSPAREERPTADQALRSLLISEKSGAEFMNKIQFGEWVEQNLAQKGKTFRTRLEQRWNTLLKTVRQTRPVLQRVSFKTACGGIGAFLLLMNVGAHGIGERGGKEESIGEQRISANRSGPSLVDINAEPWAEVWMEGRRIGYTPILSFKVPSGVHQLTVRFPGRERKREVLIALWPGERRKVILQKGKSAASPPSRKGDDLWARGGGPLATFP